MKKLLFIPVLLFYMGLEAQDLEGSWTLIKTNGKNVGEMEVVRIIQDGYFAQASKEAGSNKFDNTYGGEFQANGDEYKEVQDFNTQDPELIGKEINYKIRRSGDTLTIYDDINTFVWTKNSERDDDLNGTWVITGREREGKMNTMTPGDRRTVKILGGGRFQWIAFNSATKEFSGTGGGTYTAENGKYTENIDFFSRDDSRVGASLGFDYEVKDGEWHHSGKSSKGDPISEIWSPYSEAYQKK